VHLENCVWPEVMAVILLDLHLQEHASLVLISKARTDLLLFSSRPNNLATWVRRGGDPRSHTFLLKACAKSLHECSADARATRFCLQQNRLVQTRLDIGLARDSAPERRR
jgi:hypothetical protein